MKTHLKTAQGPACNTKQQRPPFPRRSVDWTKMKTTSHFRLVDCGGCQRTHEYRSRAARRRSP